MSRLVSRILLAILMFPLGCIVYAVASMIFSQMARSARVYGQVEYLIIFTASGLITWAFVGLYWTSLWRQSTNWTRWRVRQTLVAVAGAIVGGFFVGVLIGSGTEAPLGMFMTSVVSPLLWLFATIFIWRETDAERIDRLRKANADVLVCPACGYNLTGLKEARCPECGAQYTLNELVAAQPQRSSAELESG